MTGLQIELQDAIEKIVSISERLKENPELGEELTYLLLAVDPGGKGITAMMGASRQEVVSMFAALAEQDETFKECIMVVAALIRMKISLKNVLGGDLDTFVAFVKHKMDKAKEGSQGDAEAV